MTATGFLRRVTLASATAVSLVALLAGWLADGTVAAGVVAGGTLVVGNLWWLAAVAASAARTPIHRTRWAVVAALRFAVIAVVCGVALGSGFAHPVGIVVGLTVLPCALIVQGLRAARAA